MTPRCTRTILLATASALVVTSASAQVLISDNFEANSAADYTIVDDGTPDGVQTFAYDYIAAGIPLAPRSTAGDTKGLHLTANDTTGGTDAWTVFHNTPVTASHYKVTVDIWMNFVGTAGTTEFSHVGVGGDGLTYNSVFTPIEGTGAFFSMTGDGGVVSDFRWFRDPLNTPPGETGNTTLPNSHSSYLGHGSNGTGTFFQSLFPSPPSTIAGSPGNIWTTLEIDVDNVNGVISFVLDGQLVFQGDFGNTFEGQVSLGQVDVFSSISGVADVFSVFDNLVVEVVTGSVGVNYCTAVANTTGNPAVISASGTEVVATNDMTLIAADMPMNSFGFFLTSTSQGFTANPGGSTGNLCLSGAIGRYVGPGQVQNAGTAGEISLLLDLAQTPTPTGPVSVMAGETWNFTTWFRDSNGMGGATSNFTDGLEVVFL